MTKTRCTGAVELLWKLYYEDMFPHRICKHNEGGGEWGGGVRDERMNADIWGTFETTRGVSLFRSALKGENRGCKPLIHGDSLQRKDRNPEKRKIE